MKNSNILILGGLSSKALSWLEQVQAEDLGSEAKSAENSAHIFLYDNLQKADLTKVPKTAQFIFGDVRDEVMLRRVLKDKNISVVIWAIPEPKTKSMADLEAYKMGSLRLAAMIQEISVSKVISLYPMWGQSLPYFQQLEVQAQEK